MAGNLAAYQRLRDSYAGEIIPPPDDSYERLGGNSDSEEGYQTAPDSEGDVQSRKNCPEVDRDSSPLDPESEGQPQVDSESNTRYPSDVTYPEGYQTAAPVQGYLHDNLKSYHSTIQSSYHANSPNNNGYFRLEGFSEFCGNLETLKVSQIDNGSPDGLHETVKPGNKDCEKQTLWHDPTSVEDEDDFEVTTSCYICSFRGFLKIFQITFCVIALSFALTSRFCFESAVGVWFLSVNISCALIAGCVLVAQTYGEMDKCCVCRRKLIQILYLFMIPMLLSAGLLAASVSSSLRTAPESDKMMVMVASMFTLIALFAVITDVVMHRRIWNMFQMAGGNAYIHAAFLA